MRRLGNVLLLIALFAPQLALAQRQDTSRVSTVRLVAGGLSGLATSVALGAYVDRDCTGDTCVGRALSVILFSPVLVPIGIYVANKGQAPFSSIFWHSVGGLVAGSLVALSMYEMDHDTGVVGVPLIFAAQLTLGIMGARATRP